MSDLEDAQQWYELAQHLVRAHGGDPHKFFGWTATLEQLRFAHADTHVALASINARLPDGRTHPLPMDPGWRTARESSYRPAPPSPSARKDVPFSDPTWPGIFAFPSVWHTGLPHTSVHPRSEADLAEWAAGRFTRLEGRFSGNSPSTSVHLANITALADLVAARWLARVSFPSAFPRPAIMPARAARQPGTMNDLDDARQWDELAKHLVRAHGARSGQLIAYALPLSQFRWVHFDKNAALDIAQVRPPDGHVHPALPDPGWPGQPARPAGDAA